MRKRVRKKPAPRTYDEAAKVYRIPKKAIYQMQDIGILDTRFTPESHYRLEEIIWQIWGRWQLIKAMMSRMSAADRKKIVEAPYGLAVHEEYALNRYREHFRKGNLTELTLDRVIGEIASFKKVYEPKKPVERVAYRKDIKRVRQRALMEVTREKEKRNPKTGRGKK